MARTSQSPADGQTMQSTQICPWLDDTRNHKSAAYNGGYFSRAVERGLRSPCRFRAGSGEEDPQRREARIVNGGRTSAVCKRRRRGSANSCLTAPMHVRVPCCAFRLQHSASSFVNANRLLRVLIRGCWFRSGREEPVKVGRCRRCGVPRPAGRQMRSRRELTSLHDTRPTVRNALDPGDKLKLDPLSPGPLYRARGRPAHSTPRPHRGGAVNKPDAPGGSLPRIPE